MVAFGPWVLDPDYLQFKIVSESNGSELFDYGTSTVLAETPYQDPPYLITVGDLGAAVESAQGFIDGSSPLNLWGVSYSWGYQLSLPAGTKSVWGAGVARRICTIEAGGTYFYNPPNFGFAAPSGAIGIDYEGQPYDPGDPWASAPGEIVGRHLSSLSTLGGHWFDDLETTPDAVPAATTIVKVTSSGGAADVATVGPPDDPSDTTNPIYRTLGISVDLAPYLYTGGEWIGGHVETSSDFVSPVNDPSSGSGLVMYGWGFDDMRIDTMVRPPLYRWVFAGDEPDEVTTYRRIYPRDDGLAGGAPRNYPRSKGIQSGNRIGGGYL